jgi:hypothetical protein
MGNISSNPQNTSASHLGKKGHILVIPVGAEHIKEQRIYHIFFTELDHNIPRNRLLKKYI